MSDSVWSTKIDELVNKFEESLFAGQAPKLEDFVRQVPPRSLEKVSKELVAIEIRFAIENKESVDAEKYRKFGYQITQFAENEINQVEMDAQFDNFKSELSRDAENSITLMLECLKRTANANREIQWNRLLEYDIRFRIKNNLNVTAETYKTLGDRPYNFAVKLIRKLSSNK